MLLTGANFVSQIQQQIERLRISQMEKQLELKEASTRRKILALKQQLQNPGNKPPLTAPEKHSMSTSATVNQTIPTSKSDQTMLSSNILKIKSEAMTTSLSMSNSPLQTPPSHAVQTLPMQNTFSTSERDVHQSKALHTQHNPRDSERTKVSTPIEISKASPATITNRITHDRTGIIDPHVQQKQETKLHEKAVRVNQESIPQPVATPSTRTESGMPHSKSRQKLTLPEEIKETEYMTALQRQKARVSRIRRCIVAATVIQRAWRDYTDKLKK